MNVRPLLAVAALALAPAVASAQPASVKDIKGKVDVPPGGPPMIHAADGDYSIGAEPWRSFLLQRIGQSVEARVRVSAGGAATVLGLYRHIVATVQLPVGGAPMLAENRSNIFQVKDEPWRQFLLNVVDQQVEARIEITKPGMFGGEARVQRLWRDVTAKVIVAADGGPVMLSENRSNGYQVEDAAWRGYLMRRADQEVRVRLEVTEPGPFGGKAAVVHAALGAVEGWAQAPGSIGVNKSLTLQVKNAPFRAIVAAADGRRIKAEVRLTRPGMFGGEAAVDAILTRNGAASLPVVARPILGLQPVIARIAAGRAVRIVGATSSHYKVQVRPGVVGYVRKSALEVGEAPPADSTGITDAIPGQ